MVNRSRLGFTALAGFLSSCTAAHVVSFCSGVLRGGTHCGGITHAQFYVAALLCRSVVRGECQQMAHLLAYFCLSLVIQGLSSLLLARLCARICIARSHWVEQFLLSFAHSVLCFLMMCSLCWDDVLLERGDL